MRPQPNIIITGTPGVGKTSHCERLVQKTGFRHVSVNEVAKKKACYDGWDEERRCWIVNDDKVGLDTFVRSQVVALTAARADDGAGW